MTVKELAVLYALNSLEIVGDEIGPMEDCHVPASTITTYIRKGFRAFGSPYEGVTGPLRGLGPNWRPTKQEVVNILSALRGSVRRDTFKRHRAENPIVSVIERPGKANLYRLSRAGVDALCL
jgi:hypothetical protein